MFIDQVTLFLQAGRGGNGIVAWRREKYVPKGGPAGGDGGKGASIYFEADPHLLSLEHFRHKKVIKAENGKSGGGQNKKGKNGDDLLLKVPLGTIIRDANTKEILLDLTKVGQREILCSGGKGGKGNRHFISPTNRAPNQYTEGEAGQQLHIELELKLIADVGLVGMPNAGKSTLMSKITHSKVKIAPYPFTTLFPNLGVVQFLDFSKILIADIPGIIPDAHKNKGLGISFLKHIERSTTLLYVIDIADCENDPFATFQTLQEELKKYDPKLLDKPFLVVLNKIDIATSSLEKFKEKFPFDVTHLMEISALKEQGIAYLLKKLQEITQKKEKKISLSF